MPRTKTTTWTYECDTDGCGTDRYPFDGPASIEVSVGDACSTGLSTVVHDQNEADAHVRSLGWTVGKHVTCPDCAGGAS